MKYHVKGKGKGWITDHAVTARVFKSFRLTMGLTQVHSNRCTEITPVCTSPNHQPSEAPNPISKPQTQSSIYHRSAKKTQRLPRNPKDKTHHWCPHALDHTKWKMFLLTMFLDGKKEGCFWKGSKQQRLRREGWHLGEDIGGAQSRKVLQETERLASGGAPKHEPIKGAGQQGDLAARPSEEG